MGRSVLPHPEAQSIAYFEFTWDREYYKDLYEEEFADEECHCDESDVYDGYAECDAHPDFETWAYARWVEGSHIEWENDLDYYREFLQELFPSFEDANDWAGSENHVLVRNAHSEVSISEYCGLVALSVAPRSDLTDYYAEDIALYNIGKGWRKSIEHKFLKTFGEYRKVGTFSNGEGVYEAI